MRPSKWTPEALALLGVRYDREIAALTGLRQDSVRERRSCLGIAPLGGEAPTTPPGLVGYPTLAQAERDHITRALELAGGNRCAAARALGIDRSTLMRLMERHGLKTPRPSMAKRLAAKAAALASARNLVPSELSILSERPGMLGSMTPALPPPTPRDSTLLAALRRNVAELLRDSSFSDPVDVSRLDPRDRGVNELGARLRTTQCESATVPELATACRLLLAWDVESFYAALGLDDGDYPGLARIAGEWIDIRPMEWDT